MVQITPTFQLDEGEIQFEYVRASGPGGQNVNKVSTSVQLRFNVISSPSLTEDVKRRLIHLAGSRITDDGVLILEARRFRTQEANRQDALQRLVALIQESLKPPTPRRATRPTLTSRLKRVETKKRRGAIKRLRRNTNEE